MKHLLFILGFLLFSPGITLSLEHFDIISTEELQKLLEDRQKGKIDFLLICALDRVIYEYHHIPGSISIPLGKLSKYKEKLGKNKERLIITY